MRFEEARIYVILSSMECLNGKRSGRNGLRWGPLAKCTSVLLFPPGFPSSAELSTTPLPVPSSILRTLAPLVLEERRAAISDTLRLLVYKLFFGLGLKVHRFSKEWSRYIDKILHGRVVLGNLGWINLNRVINMLINTWFFKRGI